MLSTCITAEVFIANPMVRREMTWLHTCSLHSEERSGTERLLKAAFAAYSQLNGTKKPLFHAAA